jgi:octaheme c-type cytochrome (tetrathionate reductase family)
MFAKRTTPFPVLVITGLVLAVFSLGLAGNAAFAAKAKVEDLSSTADHSKFPSLKQKFASGPEVTKACLECHTNAAKQIHKTTHWTWEYTNPDTGQKLGKKNVVNNYCIAAVPNIASCSSCHIGYGWKDDTFDFASEENVDCLVCHDTTQRYNKKFYRESIGKLGISLSKIAQSVGPTSRDTCGACHFAGGGAKAVKHGDLDPTLKNPNFFVDVHMDADGMDFTCSTCHTSDQHAVKGSRYRPQAADQDGVDVPGHTDGDRATCESCHGLEPHPENNHPKLNDHTDRLACQTCHIPRFSRGDFPTKMVWDWSTAGKMDADGKQIHKEDEHGWESYASKKGDFVWEEWVVPEYKWFNGKVTYTLPTDTIADPTKVVAINEFQGGPNDPKARIWPIKVMRGKQPYDTESKNLVHPLTTTADGYWTTFDWQKSIELGQKAVGQPYSGKFGFVETRMDWTITHMVAPASEALQCNDCHVRNGRLEKLSGFYMPGRDSYSWLTQLGWTLALLTLAGVLAHAFIRIVMAFRKG